MTSNKDTAIGEIKHMFEKMSNLVLSQIGTLEKALKSTDNESISPEFIQKINKNELAIDSHDIRLDKLIIQTIVLYKPVASDLRQLFAVYQMVNNLERIGDLVVKISNVIYQIKDSDIFKKSLPLVNTMLSLTSTMVNKSLLSFINKDKDLATWTIKKDADIDEMNHKLLSKLLSTGEFPKESDTLLILTDIRSIVSSIERIGDHATNIAEASIYALLGYNIKHKKNEN